MTLNETKKFLQVLVISFGFFKIFPMKVYADLQQVSVDPSKKKALIFGITGQDGVLLCKLLREKGYEVFGAVREVVDRDNTIRLQHMFHEVYDNVYLCRCDITDEQSVYTWITHIRPNEIYNLAAQSNVVESIKDPVCTSMVDAMGSLYVLEAIRNAGLQHTTRLFQAVTSELFGDAQESPQCETTPFNPRNPYGIAKVFAYYMTNFYRKQYGLHASCGILYNHESPYRGRDFVTRIITCGITDINLGKKSKMTIGNLDAERDWGCADDYVKAMWLMLQQEKPDNFVLATGQKHSVREFIELGFKHIGREITWQGEGLNEKGLDKKTGDILVEIDQDHYRPSEAKPLVGCSSKAKGALNWQLEVSFKELIDKMMKAEEENAKNPSLNW